MMRCHLVAREPLDEPKGELSRATLPVDSIACVRTPQCEREPLVARGPIFHDRLQEIDHRVEQLVGQDGHGYSVTRR